ncbi:hypothetical protein R69658_01649 [Paraburkholderia aspalathi]|uniref:Apea-like HEPN domain-containing protein n=1 Tax=Paraburkholderia aspalathi TaxID=1324617 RepID=A0ABM8R1H6_9BURK|nr:hypothetical protein [Paraburkholderia aspalathi]MBK3818340.1 hypothetical protein [Paraburkholderia aspalathi]MBK3830194.1 hypothetical protein [Paraburkholderia aspalathi]MBK3859368.1 hypothetical protein [Paraburkholderia aspalathi]CAE6727375.1 hypothetical protein R69658_01649 [Paraburkholderia aspalathi]
MVNFNNFRTLDPESADLARELIEAADRQRSDFFSFVSVWMAFNGWMECVTGADSDAYMIRALTEHQRLSDAYIGLMESAADFRNSVNAFATKWPVLNVRDVRRKLGRDAFLRFSREELMNEVVREGVKHQPVEWRSGDMPTWPQLLRTMYCVRCNLFHGSKSPQNHGDHELIVSCNCILRMFIELTGCFNWHD